MEESHYFRRSGRLALVCAMEIHKSLLLALASRGDHSHQAFKSQDTHGPYCNPGHTETLSVADLTWVFPYPANAREKQSLGDLDIVRVICC